MTTEARQLVSRAVFRTVLAHSIFVLVAVIAKNALRGTTAPWWTITRVFRLVELPVLWAVDPTVQRLPLIPPWAAFGHIWVATSVSEFIAYGVFGGTFYAIVAATIAYVLQRKRRALVEGPS